jgi:hypothetical protein
MSDIIREVDEDLRREQFERLWKRYGSAVFGVSLLIVAATAGTVAWQNWSLARQQERTAVLLAATELATPSEGKVIDRAAAAAALADAATKLEGPAVALARFREAALRAELGDKAASAAIYDQLAGSGTVDPALRELAALLATLQQLDSGDPAQLQARLTPLMADTGVWRWSARELSGILSARAGDTVRAKEIFDGLAADPGTPNGVRNRAAELAALYAAPK